MAVTKQATLVLGSSGKTGRRIAARLRAIHVPVRSGSRNGEPRFDWEDRGTWTEALQGVSSAYVSYFPDLAAPGAAGAVADFAACAQGLGVRRLVLLSGRGEQEAQEAERALQASGAEWTILRCSWFMQNFSEGLFLRPLQAGTLALPAGEVPEPFVDADDIADVAVAALTDLRHAGRVLELTGPRALSFAQAVAEMARASGRRLRYRPVTQAAYAAQALAQGVSQEVVDFLGYLFGEVLDGRNASPTGDIERVLGRRPCDFADFARAAAAAGAWAAS